MGDDIHIATRARTQTYPVCQANIKRLGIIKYEVQSNMNKSKSYLAIQNIINSLYLYIFFFAFLSIPFSLTLRCNWIFLFDCSRSLSWVFVFLLIKSIWEWHRARGAAHGNHRKPPLHYPFSCIFQSEIRGERKDSPSIHRALSPLYIIKPILVTVPHMTDINPTNVSLWERAELDQLLIQSFMKVAHFLQSENS